LAAASALASETANRGVSADGFEVACAVDLVKRVINLFLEISVEPSEFRSYQFVDFLQCSVDSTLRVVKRPRLFRGFFPQAQKTVRNLQSLSRQPQ